MEKSEEERLLAIMKAFDAAWNAQDLETVMTFTTDDVVYKIGPPPLSTVAVGKKEISDSIKGLLPGLCLETWDYRVSDNKLNCKFRNSCDFYRNMGVDYVEGTNEIFFRGDEIESFHLTFSPESLRKLWAAQEE